MQGITSILDGAHGALVESLWRELEMEFGLKEACVAYPHFSYQVAGSYQVAPLLEVLQYVAAHTEPFTVSASGLGIFTGERPVLDVRLVRDSVLNQFHDQVWRAAATFVSDAHGYHYDTEHWIPHVTLAIGDLTHDLLPNVVRHLSHRTFTWQILVDNVCLVLDAQGDRQQWIRLPFGG